MTPSAEHLEKATKGMMEAYEEINILAREYVDAVMKSAASMQKGWDETARSTGGIVQESVSRAVSAGRTMMGAKSIREMMDLHSEFMKDCFDCWMAGSGKITEISTRATKEAIEPIAQHTNNAISKISQKARATA